MVSASGVSSEAAVATNLFDGPGSDIYNGTAPASGLADVSIGNLDDLTISSIGGGLAEVYAGDTLSIGAISGNVAISARGELGAGAGNIAIASVGGNFTNSGAITAGNEFSITGQVGGAFTNTTSGVIDAATIDIENAPVFINDGSIVSTVGGSTIGDGIAPIVFINDGIVTSQGGKLTLAQAVTNTYRYLRGRRGRLDRGRRRDLRRHRFPRWRRH